MQDQKITFLILDTYSKTKIQLYTREKKSTRSLGRAKEQNKYKMVVIMQKH